MSIKVTLGEAKTQEKPFPKLMISQDGQTIIYATGIKDDELGGVCLYDNLVKARIGIYDSFWVAYAFNDYNGSITLQND